MKQHIKFLIFQLGLLISIASCAQQKKNDVSIQENALDYELELVVPEVEIAWGMTWLPDDSMLYTEKSGDLIHFKDNKKTKIKNVPEVDTRGQGGLLDIELHPNYKENGWIYISYSTNTGEGNGAHTAILRAKIESNTLTSVKQLYKGSPNVDTPYHFGSRIEFDNDGFLFFSIGERGEREINPQDINRDGGKIYRLHDDGSIPKDNPFVNNENARKAIFSYGHRNPQGMGIHPTTGKLWINEHGPRGGDEINIIKKGTNYGWPVITYGVNYSGTKITNSTSKEGMEQPIYYWVPSIAPCGMTFVTGNKYPRLKNNLLVSSLKFAYVELLTLEKEQVIKREKIAEDIGRVRNVKQAPNGYVYISIEDEGIFKLKPKK